MENEPIKFRHPYWSIYTKISWLQRYIAIHSLLYYRADTNIISDSKYDQVCIQLNELQKCISREEVRTKTTFGYAYYDFDGSTGFDIVPRLTTEHKRIIECIAAICLDKYKELKGDAM